ncbi:hypothetical protein EI555_002530 [Monodon monoceros]|uniref:EF-1-gamma C-terminal domain-containing protein n=1 Tax=Monodon monoceros TaxID=40151 RepID=A0A4U1F3X1_MONMO|nr:hypothetical protein EI555_002530 [Monodon monoceros]
MRNNQSYGANQPESLRGLFLDSVPGRAFYALTFHSTLKMSHFTKIDFFVNNNAMKINCILLPFTLVKGERKLFPNSAKGGEINYRNLYHLYRCDSRQIIEKPKVEMSNIDAFPKYLRDNLLEMGGSNEKNYEFGRKIQMPKSPINLSKLDFRFFLIKNYIISNPLLIMKPHGCELKRKLLREEKQKPQAERKEKKTAAPATEEELDGRVQAVAAEPKANDPFAPLPKSTFVLDEFKRKHSNEDTLSVALPYFGEHFDKDGWSLWYAEDRFPEELTQTFMSCNLITGMFQRLDKLRKNAFAGVILFGSNNSGSISGVWVFRGQELAFPLSPDWQGYYESYTCWKLDPSSEETQAGSRILFLGWGLPARGQSLQSGQDLQGNISCHRLAARTCPSGRMGVIKGN